MPKAHTGSLLFEIQMAVKCPYLSDLHTYCHLLNKQMAEVIQSIPADRYSQDEWNEAVTYITKEDHHCKSIEDAKRRIIEG